MGFNDILEVLIRSGGAAKQYGLNFRQLLAIMTPMKERTQLSGEVIGTGLKSILARLYAQPESIAALKGAGVNVFDKGRQRDIISILNELADATKKYE